VIRMIRRDQYRLPLANQSLQTFLTRYANSGYLMLEAKR
jgi:outer membrane protein assembly factor BamD (BamD/ComL family)